MSTGTNGIGQMWRIAGVVFPGLAMLYSIFYVAFQGQASSAAIERIEVRINKMDAELRLTEDKANRQTDSLTEIETQFCGVARDINRMHANDLRLFALIWHKSFGDEYPIGNAYYPEYGRCAAQNSAH